MTELKLCPFCGGEAHLSHETEGWRSIGTYVECTKCMANIPVVEISTKYASDDKAIEKWNRRADNG